MKKLIIAFSLILASTLTAEAYLDTQHMTSKQYMLNAGYSSYMSTMAELTTRDPYAPLDDIYPEKGAKRLMKLMWKKVDSTAFPEYNLHWHDIKQSTGLSDLN